MRKVVLYADIDTPRLRYVVDVIFVHWLNCNVELHADPTRKSDLSYAAHQPEAGGLWIPAEGSAILQTEMQKQPAYSYEEAMLRLYPTAHDQAWQHDVFAAVFWFISRMEEQTDFVSTDQHGRFLYSDSFFSKNQVIPRVWVEDWIVELGAALNLEPVQPKQEVLGWDLDNAYCYKGKPIFRRLGLAMKQLLSGQIGTCLAALGLGKDPHDIYADLLEMMDGNHKWIFFIPLANRSDFDRNIGYDSKKYQELVVKLHQRAQVGIHLGYAGHDGLDEHKAEIERLESITGKQVKDNRFHYLKQVIPQSWAALEKLGIERDHSLGYADRIGARAGVSWSFPCYDLVRECALKLEVFPFIIMDETLRASMGWGAEKWAEIENELSALVRDCSQVNWVFHPDLLGEVNQWRGYSASGWKLIRDIVGRGN